MFAEMMSRGQFKGAFVWNSLDFVESSTESVNTEEARILRLTNH